MTREENLFLIHKHIKEYIYNSAKLEGLGLTYPETETILDGFAPNVPLNEAIAVNNLKRAWTFIEETADIPLTFSYISEINKHIGGDSLYPNAGLPRTAPVRIGGTSWQPEIPIIEQIENELSDILKIENKLEQAINIFLYIMRKQIFIDGNKRTANIVANKIMLMHNQGVLSVPEKNIVEFRTLLIKFYETDNYEEISKFIDEYCIFTQI